MQAWLRGYGRAAGWLGAALLAGVGCTQILGLEEWTDLPASNGNAPACADGLQNGLETDIDCGGGTCLLCAIGQKCANGTDCESQTCGKNGLCEAAPPPSTCEETGQPTCDNCVLDAELAETDVDCGGDACPPCDLDQHCVTDADCMSGTCGAAGLCVVAPTDPPCSAPDPQNPTCNDCTPNGSETDVDCGGGDCPLCDLNQDCIIDADCMSSKCGTDGHCVVAPPDPPCDVLDPQNPTCNDCTINASETDIDCGGDACPPCAAGKACLSGADCASGVCTAGTCQ